MMSRTKMVSTALALAAAVSVSSLAYAGKFNKVLSIGNAAPAWSGIVGTDDQDHALADYKDAKALVLVFTCNHCPVAVACEDRIIQLQKDYADKGVQVLAINVNNVEADRLDKMKERAAEKGFNFPYLYDPTQKIARDHGAAVTPDVVLLDGNRQVAYMGLIDDEPLNPSNVQRTYLRDAIDAVLAGQKPEIAETKPQGCGIRYE